MRQKILVLEKWIRRVAEITTWKELMIQTHI